MAEKLFCSVASLNEEEPLPGLGHPSTRTLLWRVPKAGWQELRRSVQKNEGRVAEAIRAAAKAKARVVFVNRAAALGPLPALLSYPDGVSVEDEDERRIEERVLAWCAGESLAGSTDSRIAILCCTDGRTDPCCARFGMATYRALAAAADPAVFNLVESSHLGGCRFATTILVLPAAERYGRLGPDDVPAFLAALREGRPHPPALRGLGADGEAGQVAKVAALAWAVERGLPGARVDLGGVEPDDEEALSCSLPVTVDGVRLVAVLARRSFRYLDDCAVHEAVYRAGHSRWVLERLRPL